MSNFRIYGLRNPLKTVVPARDHGWHVIKRSFPFDDDHAPVRWTVPGTGDFVDCCTMGGAIRALFGWDAWADGPICYVEEGDLLRFVPAKVV